MGYVLIKSFKKCLFHHVTGLQNHVIILLACFRLASNDTVEELTIHGMIVLSYVPITPNALHHERHVKHEKWFILALSQLPVKNIISAM